jgi:hypothetical protein
MHFQLTSAHCGTLVGLMFVALACAQPYRKELYFINGSPTEMSANEAYPVELREFDPSKGALRLIRPILGSLDKAIADQDLRVFVAVGMDYANSEVPVSVVGMDAPGLDGHSVISIGERPLTDQWIIYPPDGSVLLCLSLSDLDAKKLVGADLRRPGLAARQAVDVPVESLAYVRGERRWRCSFGRSMCHLAFTLPTTFVLANLQPWRLTLIPFWRFGAPDLRGIRPGSGRAHFMCLTRRPARGK